VTPGQRHESTCFESVMSATQVSVGYWPDAVSGDKGYSYPRIRNWIADHEIRDIIPRRSNQRVEGDENDFDRVTYRRRNVVERCIGWLKECRRIATRFEKLAVNYLNMVKLGMIQRYLRLLSLSPR
jgi:transposase